MKVPSRFVRDELPNIMPIGLSPLRGTAFTIDPEAGLPSELMTTPVILARRAGRRAKSVLWASCPRRTVIFCASLPFAVPGK